MAFIAVDESVRFAARQGWLLLSPVDLYYLYPLKALSVAALLFFFRREYRELQMADLLNARATLTACLAGIVTFVLWVCLDWKIAVAGGPAGFNPSLFPDGPIRFFMTATRIGGAVLVVPVMEELFWRSFLLRYMMNPDFEGVPIGDFSWPSFLTTTILFGLEHHLVIAGMVAGAIYNLLLYKTRSLAQCVFAHAVTNLALAIYVLYTGKWYFW